MGYTFEAVNPFSLPFYLINFIMYFYSEERLRTSANDDSYRRVFDWVKLYFELQMVLM